MLGLRWVKVAALLLVAASVCVSGATKGDTEELDVDVQNPWIYRNITMALPAESQQVSVKAATDLQASATGYGKGYGMGEYHKGHKGFKAGHRDKEDYKGRKGHKADKGHKKSHYGEYGKDHKKGHHDKGGKHYKGGDDKHKYYGDEHKGKKGKKGHHYGSKGHNNKGHKDKGFKNVYHKEEYHHQKKFYDDHDNKKYHNKYDDFDSYFKSNRGKDFKGGNYKGQKLPATYLSVSHSQTNTKGSSIMTSRTRAALNRINDIPPNSINAKVSKIKHPLTSRTSDQSTGTMRYLGRVLLDTGDISNGRTRFQQESLYDEQCQVFDLRMIRRYLKYCLRHAGEVGAQKDGAPPCTEEDLSKIKKYLNFCKKPFFAQASSSDKKQYRKLAIIANKLDRRNNIIEEEVYYSADVCNVGELRQMKAYLNDCYSGKENAEGERSECNLENLQKSLDYLSNCQKTFFLEASRQDKRQYDRLISIVSTLIQREKEHDEITKMEEVEESKGACQVEDLREAQSYVTECQKLMKVQDYQKLYGTKVCRPSHLSKINRYLLGCEQFFLTNASDNDKKKYMDLVSISESLGVKSKQKTGQQTAKTLDHPECKIEDLRKVPSYLKSCDKSQSCKIKQLSKVHEFLAACEEFFLKSASQSDRIKYSDFILKSEMLSTKESIYQWRENTGGERKRIESICKIHVLRKVPNYLKACLKSRDCKIRQLLKVQEFLSLCENFFTVAASPKDRGKYKELRNASTELVKQGRGQERRQTREMRRSRKLNCNITDLRKIPKYLNNCVKLQNCKGKQLRKIYQFLFICEIPFTSTASMKDKDKYKRLITISKELSTGRNPSVEKPGKRRDSDISKCEIEDLRKIPQYLKKCQRLQSCKGKMLLTIHGFLQTCKHAFTERATRKEIKEYDHLEFTVKELINTNQKKPIKNIKQEEQKKKKETDQSMCQLSNLRKVPQYISKCLESKDCKQRQLSKVHDFLKACKIPFKAKTSRKDSHRYMEWLNVSGKSISRDHQQIKRRTGTENSKQTCKVRELRTINNFLNSFDKNTKNFNKMHNMNGPKDFKRGNLIRALKYLTTCKKTLTRNASLGDKRKYEKMISLSKKLERRKFLKDSNESETKKKKKMKRVVPHRSCRVQDLRTALKHLSKCTTGFTQKDPRHTGQRKGIAKGEVTKIITFLASCKTDFLKKASKSDKRRYEELVVLTKKCLSPKTKIDVKSKVKGSTLTELVKCKVQKLKDIQKNLKVCAEDITKSDANPAKNKKDNRRKQGSKNNQCSKIKLTKMQVYLQKCQTTFFERALAKNKKQYKYLTDMAIKLSQQIGRKIAKRDVKTPPIFSCNKQDLVKLEKHYKYCKAKSREDQPKRSEARRGRIVRLHKKRVQEKAKEMSAKRQFTKCECSSYKNCKSIENERRKSPGRRAENKNRPGRKYYDQHGKKGHHDKGKYHDDHKGEKSHYEHKGHYGDKSSYGKRGGHKGEYGHDDHKGHGKDNHHGGGYGHDDHHGHGYGHDDHHGHGYGHDDHHGGHHGHGGYGHDDHGGHGSHSNIQPVSASPKVAAPTPVYPAPVYVPAPTTVVTKAYQPSGFYPSPKLVVPPSYIHPPAATSSVHHTAASGVSPVGAHFGVTPLKAHTFGSFGDFGRFS